MSRSIACMTIASARTDGPGLLDALALATAVADERPYADGWRTSMSPRNAPTGCLGERVTVAETRW